MFSTFLPFHDPEDTAAVGPLALNSQDFFETSPVSFNVQKPIRYFVSSLFSAGTGHRELVREAPLASLSRSKRYTYSGAPLDQFDLDVLLHCTAAAGSSRRRGAWTEHAQLVRTLGKRNDAATRKRVCESLARLQECTIGIEGDGYRYMTRLVNRALLDEGAGASLVEVNSDFADSIRSMRGLDLLMQERRAMGANGLAKWLHGVLWIIPAGFSSNFATLSELCGMRSTSSHGFRTRCLGALDLLVTNGVVTEYSVEDSGGLYVSGRRNNTRASACGFFSLPDTQRGCSRETVCAHA